MTVAEVARAEQTRNALRGANLIRRNRARLKRRIRAGGSIQAVIANPPKCARTATVEEALIWPHRMGKFRARRILRWADVSGTRTLGNLTDRERQSLREQCRLAGLS